MPANWTKELLGYMCSANVTEKELAEEAGWDLAHLSAVLCGQVDPEDAEGKLDIAFNRVTVKRSIERGPYKMAHTLEELVAHFEQYDPEYAKRLKEALGLCQGQAPLKEEGANL